MAKPESVIHRIDPSGRMMRYSTDLVPSSTAPGITCCAASRSSGWMVSSQAWRLVSSSRTSRPQIASYAGETYSSRLFFTLKTHSTSPVFSANCRKRSSLCARARSARF
jgi:hypothetical protein